MSNKRSRRKKTVHFHCPSCQQRLWRSGSIKHYIYYKDANQIKANTGITQKKAKFLINKNSTYLDNKKWIESFFCPEHGVFWLLVKKTENGYDYRLAEEKDWLQTNKTLDPRLSNPSVSEFTLRMSRKSL